MARKRIHKNDREKSRFHNAKTPPFRVTPEEREHLLRARRRALARTANVVTRLEQGPTAIVRVDGTAREIGLLWLGRDGRFLTAPARRAQAVLKARNGSGPAVVTRFQLTGPPNGRNLISKGVE